MKNPCLGQGFEKARLYNLRKISSKPQNLKGLYQGTSLLVPEKSTKHPGL